MHVELTEEQKSKKEELRIFLEKEVLPFVEQYESSKELVPREFVKKMVPFGLIGGLLPVEAGGRGMDLITYLGLIEELSRVWPSLRIMVAGTNLLCTYVYRYGTDRQKEKFMQPLLAGEMLGYFALSEPNTGSDAASIQTTAVMQDGQWILNGTKAYIANGLDGELGLVFALTNPELGAKGITAFLVQKDVSSYDARPVVKMGTHCCSLAELIFKDTLVPLENRLGEAGKGLGLAMGFLSIVRCAVPFVCAGVAQACIDASVKFCKERMQFGQPIGSFQLIQEKIANMVTLTEAMRLLGYKAAYLVDKGLPNRKEVSMAKLFASEAVLKVAEHAMQIHGQYGYVQDWPVERFYRDIRYFTVADGTSEMHRLIIGKELLGISAFV